ncbi:isocitrate lyase/phosphoenolpyruvate mutase family protein [Mycobacterium sp.]|jgi:2-methylisocitrate lyase-like PEP mutase family enzyme|uniref:isocitrate lyase/PEP mutase family protein n=1 Tax=Mycobacterium sp. TaxID=1785 RepID=UPI002D2DEE6E|nr:isocitrate lyase/phosphoenolpyruvate mutase family protein [Mycobacterium sp.]HZA12499.1 isocitrate lyase/phosphoenolpyruvate mutase family protein [Mycobacterium sp.]
MNFRELHHCDTPLVLPNAWDVPSALAFVAAGFRAVGTTSFGVASGLGRPDGDRSTKEANVRLAWELARIDCYLSIDIEDGYADEPHAVADYVAHLPAAGINIEDSTAETLIAPERHAAKVGAIKQRRPDVFVNARVDTYWLDQDATVEATLERAQRYVDAGADGIFVPGVIDAQVIRELSASIPRPLNVLAIPEVSLEQLAALGVRRVSTGSLPYRAAIHAATETALAVRAGRPVPASSPYGELQTRLVHYAGSRRG